MTDQDKQTLSEKIAALAEAQGIDPALLWDSEYLICTEGHYTHRNLWGAKVGDPCRKLLMKCHKPLKAIPLDMTDPAVLVPVVDAWIDQDEHYRDFDLEHWINQPQWVCKISVFHKETHTWSAYTGMHRKKHVLAEALAFQAMLEGEKGAHHAE